MSCRSHRQPTVALLALLLLTCVVAGCGSGARRSASARAGADAEPAGGRYTVGPGGYIVGDDDTDDLYHGKVDSDDSATRGYGHEAPAGDLRAVGALVRSYYAAAAAGEAARACALMYAPLARRTDFAHMVPEEFAEIADSSLFRGHTCSQVEKLLFELDWRTLRAAAPTVRITALRVRGAHGLALLSFKAVPEREIAVEREGRRWRIDALLDSEIV